MIEIRQLIEQDAEQLFLLACECSPLAPEAFHSITSYSSEEDKQQQIQTAASQLAASTPGRFRLGAFEDGVLLGTIGLNQNPSPYVNHRGMLFGLFIKPNQQGKGLATQLMQAAINRARELPEIEQLHLGVHAENPSAIHIYEKLGFTSYCTIPRALKSNGRYIDEYEMIMYLNQ